MTDVPPTRYARSGDLSIAYQVIGDGPMDVVLSSGWISHLDLSWEQPLLAHYITRPTSYARVLNYDKRGSGLSDRVSTVPTLEECMDDTLAVMDDAGMERAALIGHFDSAAVFALFAATYPERTSALVIVGRLRQGESGRDLPDRARPRGLRGARRDDRRRRLGAGPVRPLHRAEHGRRPGVPAVVGALRASVRRARGRRPRSFRMAHEVDIRDVLLDDPGADARGAPGPAPRARGRQRALPRRAHPGREARDPSRHRRAPVHTRRRRRGDGRDRGVPHRRTRRPTTSTGSWRPCCSPTSSTRPTRAERARRPRVARPARPPRRRGAPAARALPRATR